MSRTIFLMVCLMLLFMWIGQEIGGEQGMITAFWMACAMNFTSYFFSDSIVLSQYKATRVDENNAPELYDIVGRLAMQANLPMPKVYIIPEQVPNAFATGRDHKHAAVAVTQGLMELMTPEEIEGVLAHEMSHINHYDILIGSVAAVFAGAIAMVGNTLRSSSARQSNRSGIVGILLAPIAATMIQMAISRTREYKADEGAAYLTAHPEWLMSALTKLEGYAQNNQMQRATKQTAHMFIVNPFSGLKSFSHLFSTHPSTEKRVARLAAIKENFEN